MKKLKVKYIKLDKREYDELIEMHERELDRKTTIAFMFGILCTLFLVGVVNLFLGGM